MKDASNPAAGTPQAGTGDDDASDCALRCACGSLLARHVAGGIELKCRRCKRTLVIPLQAGDAA